MFTDFRLDKLNQHAEIMSLGEIESSLNQKGLQLLFGALLSMKANGIVGAVLIQSQGIQRF
jgi:hypothetical protein